MGAGWPIKDSFGNAATATSKYPTTCGAIPPSASDWAIRAVGLRDDIRKPPHADFFRNTEPSTAPTTAGSSAVQSAFDKPTKKPRRGPHCGANTPMPLPLRI